MQDCKDNPTPLVTKLSTESREENEPRFPYREAVGSLLHLSTKTRPDLAYAVNVESRTLENPDKTAVQNMKRTHKYLQRTQDLKIKYASTKGETIKLEAFSDADYAGDTKDKKSTTGYVIFMAGGLITWCSRKQEIVALSTTEADIAAAECCKELKYLKPIIQELTNMKVEINMYGGNQSAIKQIDSGQVNRKNKHMDACYHYISEQLAKGLFCIKYCKSEQQTADNYTKPLPVVCFTEFRDLMLRIN
jgi:hypothetical protein